MNKTEKQQEVKADGKKMNGIFIKPDADNRATLWVGETITKFAPRNLQDMPTICLVGKQRENGKIYYCYIRVNAVNDTKILLEAILHELNRRKIFVDEKYGNMRNALERAATLRTPVTSMRMRPDGSVVANIDVSTVSFFTEITSGKSQMLESDMLATYGTFAVGKHNEKFVIRHTPILLGKTPEGLETFGLEKLCLKNLFSAADLANEMQEIFTKEFSMFCKSNKVGEFVI